LAYKKLDTPKEWKKANFDTIKLSPPTIERLRCCYFRQEGNNRLDTLTYDELLNNLLDKIQEQKKESENKIITNK
jgi:hypothetical protein